MTDSMSKHVKVGEWIFEVKMVRALKVDEYGQPYSAIANCNVNGDTMYVDGLLTKEQQNLTKDDFYAFAEFGKIMDLKQISYHRYQNGQSVTKDVMVEAKDNVATSFTDNAIRLVT